MIDLFGNQDISRGAKLPSQNEWNELNRSLTNINLGTNNFNTPDVNQYGVNLPSDAFFFPHVGQTDDNRLNAVIGPDREEDFYPYVDAMGVATITEITQLEFIGGVYEYFGVNDRDTSFTAVLFPVPSEIEPDVTIDESQAQQVATPRIGQMHQQEGTGQA